VKKQLTVNLKRDMSKWLENKSLVVSKFGGMWNKIATKRLLT